MGEGEIEILAFSCLQMYQWKNGTKLDFLREKAVDDPQLIGTSFAYMSASSFRSLSLSQHSLAVNHSQDGLSMDYK